MIFKLRLEAPILKLERDLGVYVGQILDRHGEGIIFQSQSPIYPNRNNPELGRVYLDFDVDEETLDRSVDDNIPF